MEYSMFKQFEKIELDQINLVNLYIANGWIVIKIDKTHALLAASWPISQNKIISIKTQA